MLLAYLIIGRKVKSCLLFVHRAKYDHATIKQIYLEGCDTGDKDPQPEQTRRIQSTYIDSQHQFFTAFYDTSPQQQRMGHNTCDDVMTRCVATQKTSMGSTRQVQ